MTPSLPEPDARRHGSLRRSLGPGLRLMARLNLPAKLMLVAASLVLPMALLVVMALQDLVEVRHVAEVEQQGVAVADLLLPVAQPLLRHRNLVFRLQSGEAQAAAPLEDARKALAQALSAVDARLAAGMAYPLDDAWQPLREQIEGLMQGRYSPKAFEAASEQSRVYDALSAFAQLNGERSELVLDPQASTYRLMEVVVNSSLPLLDAVARVRGSGTAILARGEAEPWERAEALGNAKLIQRLAADIHRSYAALERAGGEVPGSWPKTLAHLQTYASGAQAAFTQGATAEPLAFQTEGSEALAQVVAVAVDTSRRLQTLLRARQQDAEHKLMWASAVVLASLLAVGYLITVFTVNVRGALRELALGAQAIANGNLSHRIQVRGRDELATIGNTMDGMTQRLSSLVAEIRSSASMVNLTGQQVSDGSSRLARRTDEQAQSLRESVQAIHALSGTMTHNAEAARQVDGLTERLATQATDSNAAMEETVQAMQQMQQASARVAEVVGVIDDVAFQTSMLSLNAAIEASKAGDAGKGFAVVAVEVRQLAQRCSESAEEIRRLIGDAQAQVEVSSSKLGHLRQSLVTIVTGVQSVSTQLRGIATSSSEQSESLTAITQTVGNLDEITKDNASLVEESAAASNALVNRADQLRAAVSTMRLRQGSADEAVEFVQRARQHLATVGREQALLDFHDPEGGYIDRDLYIFAIDREGIFRAMGGNPLMAGQPVLAVPGLDHQFVEDAWAAADSPAGQGWVRYNVVNPTTGTVMPKESFVQPIDADILIGCGVYHQEADASRAKPRAAARARTVEQPAAPTAA